MTPRAPLAAAIEALDGRERWTRTATIHVDGDAGHPQGLLPWAGGWLVTTVHLDPVRAEVLVVDPDGSVRERIDVTDGPRIHPGGAARHGDGCVLAVAEYRPDSTTVLRRIDASHAVTDVARIDDHLGAVCELDDGTLFAASWGSRRLYRLDAEGHVLQRRPNPSRFVEFQDVTPAGPTSVVATGIGTIAAPTGPVQLGGVALLDVDDLSVIHAAPVQAWMPSGRVATYNGAHLETTEDGLALTAIVDDGVATIDRWTTGAAGVRA